MAKKQVQLTEKDVLEFEEENVKQSETNTPDSPPMDSPDWTKFILEQLTPDEVTNGKPKCSGIRRMVEKFVGPILARRITQCFPPKDKNGIATIVYEVALNVSNPKHPQFSLGTIVEQDVADAGPDNTPYPFNRHQSATAATRAEARVLRKILRINVIAAEEGNMDENKMGSAENWEPSEKINDDQINFIDIFCQRNDLDVYDFINCGSIKYRDIRDITNEQAGAMIQYLDAIQRGENPRPKNVGKYNKEWKK